MGLAFVNKAHAADKSVQAGRYGFGRLNGDALACHLGFGVKFIGSPCDRKPLAATRLLLLR